MITWQEGDAPKDRPIIGEWEHIIWHVCWIKECEGWCILQREVIDRIFIFRNQPDRWSDVARDRQDAFRGIHTDYDWRKP